MFTWPLPVMRTFSTAPVPKIKECPELVWRTPWPAELENKVVVTLLLEFVDA